MTKQLLMAGAAATALLAAPAWAQDTTTAGTNAQASTGQDAPPAGDATSVDQTAPGDIIVTAQKRSERLQDVPIAVSVIGGAQIAAQGGINLETAQNIIPTLNIQKSGSTLNQSLFMRGVGTATFSIAGEPSVSTVVDGVVLSRGGEAFGDLVDIDRIEVLRGPQGTLFGKNASAGVINIVTKRPTAEFGGYAEASFFTEAEYRARVALNAPLSANVRSRITAFYSNYDGNIDNVTRDTKVNGYERYGIRGIIEADVTPDIRATLIGEYRRSDDDCCAQLIGTVGTGQAFQVLPTPRGDETRTVTQNLITRSFERGYAGSLQLDASLGDYTLTSITAYRNYKNREIRDGDWLPQAYIGLAQLHDDGPQRGDTFSQEVRLTSPGGKLLDYVVGAYYSHAFSQRVFTRSSIVCNALVAPAPTTPTPCTSPLAAPSRTPVGVADYGSVFKNFALFGNGTLNVSDSFRLIGGLRYTADTLDVNHVRTATGLDRNAAGQPVATGGINPSFGPFAASTSNTNVSGKGGVQFDLAPSSTTYATYTRGYKGPGANIFFGLGATNNNFVEAETSDSFEIGLKNTLFDNRLVLNVAAFYAKYENFQANNPDLINGNPPTVVSRFTNAGKASTRGVEVDLIARPAEGFTINGGAAYTDAKVDAFKIPPGANPAEVIPSGTPLLFAPKFKGSLSFDYEAPTTGSVTIYASVQGSYQSSQLSIFSPVAALRALGTIAPYGLVNLSLGFGDADGRWRVSAHVRNLFDQSYAAFLESGGPGGSIRYQIPRDADRYFGLTGKINFGSAR